MNCDSESAATWELHELGTCPQQNWNKKYLSTSSKYKQPELRPKGLGLGADKVVKAKQAQTSKDGKQEELILMKNAFVKITCGKYSDFYGKVVSLDEDNGRVMVDIPLKKETVSLSEFMMQVVTKTEYDRESKVIRKQTGPHVSVNIKQEIIELHRKRYPVSDIARQLNIARNTVYLWINRWKDEGILDAHVPSGRPRKLSAKKEAFLIKDAQSNECNMANLAIKHGVSAATIRRCLYNRGMKYKKKTTENMTEDNAEKPILEDDEERYQNKPNSTQIIETTEFQKKSPIELDDEVLCRTSSIDTQLKISEIKEECREDIENSSELQIDNEILPQDTETTEVVKSSNLTTSDEICIKSESDEEKRRKRTLEHRRQQIIALHEQNYSVAAIAKRLDIATQAVKLCIQCWKLRESGNSQTLQEDLQKKSSKQYNNIDIKNDSSSTSSTESEKDAQKERKNKATKKKSGKIMSKPKTKSLTARKTIASKKKGVEKIMSKPNTKSLTVIETDDDSSTTSSAESEKDAQKERKTNTIRRNKKNLNMKSKQSTVKSNYHISEVQRENIIELYNQKQNISEIARLLKISRKTAILWIKRWKREGALKRKPAGGRPPKLGATEVAVLEEAVKQTENRTLSDIATNHGVSTATLRRRLKHHGIRFQSNRKPVTKKTICDDSSEENEEQSTAKYGRVSVAKKIKMLRLYEKKHSISAIARHLNVTKATVLLWIKRWQNEGTIDSRAGTGRPKILSVDARARLKKQILKGRPMTVGELAKNYGVSKSTIRRFLRGNWEGDQDPSNLQTEDQDTQGGLQDGSEDETSEDSSLSSSKETKVSKTSLGCGKSHVLTNDSSSCNEVQSDRLQENTTDSDESQNESASNIDHDSSTSTSSSECESSKYLTGKNKSAGIEAANTKFTKKPCTDAKTKKQSVAGGYISQAKREKIIELHNQKQTITVISRRLKISRKTAMLWIERWKREGALKQKRGGGRRLKLGDTETAVLEEVVTQTGNRTMYDIATSHGVSTATIRRRLKHHGIRFKAKRKPVTKEMIRDDSPVENKEHATAKSYHISDTKRAKILKLYEKKHSISAIAKHLNVTYKTVRLWITRWQKEGTINSNGRKGRPRKLSADVEARLMERPLGTISEVRDLATSLGVSISTIRRWHANKLNSLLNDEENLPNIHLEDGDSLNVELGEDFLPNMQLGDQGLSNKQLGDQGLSNKQRGDQALSNKRLNDQGLPSKQLGNQELPNKQFSDSYLTNWQQGFQDIFSKAVLNNYEDKTSRNKS